MSPDFIRYAAKAVAALVVPWLLAGLAWLSTSIGVDIGVKPGVLETAVVSIVTALVVYFRSNAEAPAEDG